MCIDCFIFNPGKGRGLCKVAACILGWTYSDKLAVLLYGSMEDMVRHL